MPKTRKFSELRAQMTPKQVQEASKIHQKLLEEMPLHQLRKAHRLTQERLAAIMDVNQSEISKIEKRTDLYISTLASYISAMGGRLEIRAVFPDGSSAQINQFETIES